MTTVDLAVFSTGWVIGWLLLWRTRPLPNVDPSDREPIAAIVPARNEARSIGGVVDRIVAQLRPGDEFVVVDDQSDDGTAAIARDRGARVESTAPAHGWLGKPHACWRGAGATAAPALVFVDADVLPSARLLDDVAAVVRAHPDVVVSVQPWHRTERWYEQASLLFNVTALMGSGAFTVLGERVRPTVAFGPVLAMQRRRYDEIGGHEAVRSRHTEDIGLARLVGGAVLFTGRPDTTFRMYPDGWRQLVDGWTRTIAAGIPLDPLVGGARRRVLDRRARRWLAGRRSPDARCGARGRHLRALRTAGAGCSGDGPDRSTRSRRRCSHWPWSCSS